MLSNLFNVTVFVMVFFLGALASPVTKPQGELVQRSDLTKRYSNTQWTWYDVETGNQVYCGGYYHNDDAIVALSGANMNQSVCGKRIKMTYNGITQYATIVDMCPSCQSGALDLSRGLFSNFASINVGVIHGDWDFA